LSEEIAALHPTWLHHLDENRFQIQLHEDYSLYSTQGFSGSPIFLIAKMRFIYLVFLQDSDLQKKEK